MKIKILLSLLLFSQFGNLYALDGSSGNINVNGIQSGVNYSRDLLKAEQNKSGLAYVDQNTSATSATPCTLTITVSSSPYYCTSSYEGSATVTPSGGISPYTYYWLPGGQTTPTISGLTPGTYSVSVVDSSGCTATNSVIVVTGTLNATATPPSIIAGDSTLLSATYGTSATYSWSPTAYVSNPNSPDTYAHPPVTTLFSVIANTDCGSIQKFVTVTVTGCTFSDSIVKTPYFCNSLQGSVTVNPYGGILPYTYSWAPGGQTTASISGLGAGGYDVIITDANGCNLTNDITVESSAISYSVTGNPLFIAAGDSSLITATCNAPATFSWAPAATVTNSDSAGTYAHPIAATDYVVTINTACGTYLDTLLISIDCFPIGMSSTPSYNCESSYDGSATVTPSGGAAPYTYLWTPTGGTNASISNLLAGTYTVTVYDNLGCESVGIVTVPVVSPILTATAAPSSIIAGDSTYLSASCSLAATYSWAPAAYVSNPNSQNTYAHPPVTTIFTVTAITDTCGFVVSTYDTVIVTGCTFSDSIIKTSYYCASLEGSITVKPYGGTSPYTYLWTPGGQTTSAITGLSAGSYDVTITDATGCNLTNAISMSSGTISYTVSGNPTSIIVGDSTFLTSSCNVPATFSWSPPSSVTNPASANTYAHPTVTTEYTVTINTVCGTYIDSVLINVACFNFTMSSTSSYCSSGTATISPAGGSPPYTYSWSPGGETTSTISGLTAGIYNVIAYDTTGCYVAGSVTVGSLPVTYSVSGTPLYITRGDSALLTASCNAPATYSWSPTVSVTNPDSAITYVHPTITTDYTVIITTACTSYIDVVQIYVNCFNLTDTSTPSYCSSYDGIAMVTSLGGIPPYTYSWAPGGQTTAMLTGLSAGSYSIVVYDSAGCSATEPVVISEASGPPPITSSVTPDSIMPGDSAYLTADCGVFATYVWSPTTGLTDPNSQNTYAHPAITTVYTVNVLTLCGTAIAYDTVIVYTCADNYDEPICMVTVDTATNNCEVIWGRTNAPPSGGYGSFYIYKDSSAGYELTHSQPLNILSSYIDPLSSPSVGPVSYELTTVDSCGESALSPPHTSIYLTVTAGINAYILNWTPYIGFTPTWYRIFRGPSSGSLVQIDSVANTVLTFQDSLPPASSIYLVEAISPTGACIPTTHRPTNLSSTYFAGSFSNSVYISALGVQPIGKVFSNLNIYPNPNNGIFTLNYSLPESGNVQISIINELGQVVYLEQKYISNGPNSEQLNLEDIASGIYSLRLQTNGSNIIRKIVIMKNR